MFRASGIGLSLLVASYESFSCSDSGDMNPEIVPNMAFLSAYTGL